MARHEFFLIGTSVEHTFRRIVPYYLFENLYAAAAGERFSRWPVNRHGWTVYGSVRVRLPTTLRVSGRNAKPEVRHIGVATRCVREIFVNWKRRRPSGGDAVAAYTHDATTGCGSRVAVLITTTTILSLRVCRPQTTCRRLGWPFYTARRWRDEIPLTDRRLPVRLPRLTNSSVRPARVISNGNPATSSGPSSLVSGTVGRRRQQVRRSSPLVGPVSAGP